MAKNNRPSPNDQRSNVKNPNNPAHDKSHGNRGAQLNPNRTERSEGSNAQRSE